MRYNIDPGALRPLGSNSLIREEELQRETALEGSLYFADRIEFNDNFVLNVGAQFALYAALGPAIQRNYLPDSPKSDLSVADIVTYPANTLYAQKVFPNYRLSGRYKFSANTSVKFAAISIYQFIHSLSNNTTASPIDTWRISSNHLRPQASQQLSLGVFHDQPQLGLEISLEGFYKRQENLVDFKTGAQLFMNEFIETDVLQGQGKAYGVEFLLRKAGASHRLVGVYLCPFVYSARQSFSHRTGQQWRVFPDQLRQTPRPEYRVELPNGETPEFIHQRLVSNRSPHYTPGRELRFRRGRICVLFSNRNAYRIPDYYRVDASLNYDYKKRKAANALVLLGAFRSIISLGETILFRSFLWLKTGRLRADKVPFLTCPFLL